LTLAKKLSDERTLKFTEQYNLHYPLVFASIYSKIGNHHEAEDICQEVFLRLYKKFDEVENPRKWLFGTLRIVVLDYYKEQTKPNVNTETLFEDASISFVNGFKDTRLIIKEALNSIEEKEGGKDKIVFDLVAVHNFTLVQVCKQLNMTYKQVRYSFDKIVRQLTSYLNDKGIKTLEDLL